MLYNFPGRTGVDLRPEFVERLAELKNFRYIKDSTGETWRISEIIRALRRSHEGLSAAATQWLSRP